jgi:glutathione S-transferase
MKLYWAPKTRSFRALWLMEEAGVPYERVLVDIRGGAQNDPAYRAINPMMKVPALTDGDAMVAESAAICAYVADAVPQAGLAPPIGDPRRGRYLHWLFFAGSCIEAGFAEKFSGMSLPSMQAGWGSFARVVDVLDGMARAAAPWALGAQFTAADIMLGSDLFFGINQFKVIEPRPALVAYVERCISRPAFHRAATIDETGI